MTDQLTPGSDQGWTFAEETKKPPKPLFGGMGATAQAALFFGLGGLLVLLTDNGNPMLGVGILVLAAGAAASFVMGRSDEPQPVRPGAFVRLPDGRETRGLVLPIPAKRQKAGTIMLLFWAAGSGLVALNPPANGLYHTLAPWALGPTSVVLGAYALGTFRRWKDDPIVALTTDGVLVSGVEEVYVPWRAITTIGQTSVRTAAFLEIRFDRSLATWRAATLLSRRDRVGLSYSMFALTSADLLYLFTRLWQSAEARTLLSSQDVLAKLGISPRDIR